MMNAGQPTTSELWTSGTNLRRSYLCVDLQTVFDRLERGGPCAIDAKQLRPESLANGHAQPCLGE